MRMGNFDIVRAGFEFDTHTFIDAIEYSTTTTHTSKAEFNLI